ncbi:AraC family transcriptional regulator [bacterium]|nr:MAG: AraC family transcriptional regulator [bacterium]
MSPSSPLWSDEQRRDWLEAREGNIVAFPNDYAAGHFIDRHCHSRSQLLYVETGSIMTSTSEGRWMVPTKYALWIPAGVEHSVEIFSRCSMKSVYISPDAITGLAENVRVLGLTPLALNLMDEAMKISDNVPCTPREHLLLELLIHETPRLPEQPLGLPFPSEPRLAALCRGFLETPSPHDTIDDWASKMAMSRRTFTRAFLRETGISFSVWRQQACLLAAIPRLSNGEPVTIIALDLGYDSPAAFTTMFKRMLGTPPRSYFAG